MCLHCLLVYNTAVLRCRLNYQFKSTLPHGTCCFCQWCLPITKTVVVVAVAVALLPVVSLAIQNRVYMSQAPCNFFGKYCQKRRCARWEFPYFDRKRNKKSSSTSNIPVAEVGFHFLSSSTRLHEKLFPVFWWWAGVMHPKRSSSTA